MLLAFEPGVAACQVGSSAQRSDDEAPSRDRGDGGVFAAAMITCSVASTAIAAVSLVPAARSDPYTLFVVSSAPASLLAHVELLACPAIAMSLAGPARGRLFGELVLGAAIGLLAGSAAGALVVWPVDQASLGRPPAAALAMIGAFVLGSLGTTIGAITARELHLGPERAVVTAVPLDGGVFVQTTGRF